MQKGSPGPAHDVPSVILPVPTLVESVLGGRLRRTGLEGVVERKLGPSTSSTTPSVWSGTVDLNRRLSLLREALSLATLTVTLGQLTPPRAPFPDGVVTDKVGLGPDVPGPEPVSPTHGLGRPEWSPLTEETPVPPPAAVGSPDTRVARCQEVTPHVGPCRPRPGRSPHDRLPDLQGAVSTRRRPTSCKVTPCRCLYPSPTPRDRGWTISRHEEGRMEGSSGTSV